MSKIALFVRPSEFFKEKVSQAISKNKLGTSETAEFYLVDLLDRYMITTNISNDPLAIQLLKAQEAGVTEIDRVKILKKLGDTSLYISGFFGDSLNRKVVDLDYYRNIGAIAYRSLAETIKEESFHELYEELHTKFTAFAEILNAISHELLPPEEQKLLRFYETLATDLKDKLNKT